MGRRVLGITPERTSVQTSDIRDILEAPNLAPQNDHYPPFGFEDVSQQPPVVNEQLLGPSQKEYADVAALGAPETKVSSSFKKPASEVSEAPVAPEKPSEESAVLIEAQEERKENSAAEDAQEGAVIPKAAPKEALTPPSVVIDTPTTLDFPLVTDELMLITKSPELISEPTVLGTKAPVSPTEMPILVPTTFPPAIQTVTVTTTSVSRVIEETTSVETQPVPPPPAPRYDRLETLLEQLNSKILDSILQQKNTEEVFKEHLEKERALRERLLEDQARQQQLQEEEARQKAIEEDVRQKGIEEVETRQKELQEEKKQKLLHEKELQAKKLQENKQKALEQEEAIQRAVKDMEAKIQAVLEAGMKVTHVSPIINPTILLQKDAPKSKTFTSTMPVPSLPLIIPLVISSTESLEPTGLPKAVLSQNRPPNKVSLKPQFQGQGAGEKAMKPFVYGKPKNIWLNEMEVTEDEPVEPIPEKDLLKATFEEDKLADLRSLFPELQKILGAISASTSRTVQDDAEGAFLMEDDDEELMDDDVPFMGEKGSVFDNDEAVLDRESVFKKFLEEIREEKPQMADSLPSPPTPSEKPRNEAFATFGSFEELDRSYRKNQLSTADATTPPKDNTNSVSKTPSKAASKGSLLASSGGPGTAKKRRKDSKRKSSRNPFENALIPGAIFENGSSPLLASLVLFLATAAVLVQWQW